MSVYVIASLTIKDTVRFEDYKGMVLPSMEKYGGDSLPAAARFTFSRESGRANG